MRLAILAIGRQPRSPETALYEAYTKRVRQRGRQLGFDAVRLSEIKDQKNANEKLLAALAALPDAFIIALDERGQQMTSHDFADQLGTWRDDGVGQLVFVLGAADGLSDAVRTRADMVLALGSMTWPHMLARTLLAEQLWRAISILAGHPYHRDA